MIYLLEFSHPLGNENHRAKYYLGYCQDDGLDSRLEEHRNGYGAAITRAAVERGFTLELVGTLPGDRNEERRLKRYKKHSQIARMIGQQEIIE